MDSGVNLRIRQVAGGGRNVTLHITGMLTKGDMPLTPIDLSVPEKSRAKIASLVWLVQEKLGIYLWWNKETILLPMESRNTVRFDSPLNPPENWDGRMWLSSFGWAAPCKAFFAVLDFDL